MPTSKIRENFKLIAFVSGSFWMTYIPFVITIFLSKGLSAQLEYSNETLLSVLTFSCLFVIIYGSSCINPVLQFYLDADLWIGLQRLFGRKLLFGYQREIREAMEI